MYKLKQEKKYEQFFLRNIISLFTTESYLLPEDDCPCIFLGKLPNPELPLAIELPNDSLEYSSILGSLVLSSRLPFSDFSEGPGL